MGVLNRLMSQKEKSDSFNHLLIGAGRGGTSLLAGLLDAHPDLEMGFEAFAYDYLMGKEIDNDSLQTRLDLFEKHCLQSGNRSEQIWGNKITSEQVYALSETENKAWMHDFFEQIAKPRKLIYILRDGRTCIRSKIQRADRSYDFALKTWKFSIELWQYLEANHTSLYTLKFEDLIVDPETKLKEICAFLEIKFSPKMLAGTSNSKMKEEYQRNHFDKKVLEIPAESDLWEKDISDELKLLNYPL